LKELLELQSSIEWKDKNLKEQMEKSWKRERRIRKRIEESKRRNFKYWKRNEKY